MNKLVKKRVLQSDPVRDLVQRELRHVSSTAKLNELGRVLTRNRFVLVDKKYMVTSSDLLKLLSSRQKSSIVLNPTLKPIEQQPQPDTEKDGNCDGIGLKLTGAALVGMGIAASATYLFMKQQS